MDAGLNEILMRALDETQSWGAHYADMRIVNIRTESLWVKYCIVENLFYDEFAVSFDRTVRKHSPRRI